MLQLIVSALTAGSTLALPAMGLTLTYRLLGFPNFAYGDLMAVGAYVAFGLQVRLGMSLGRAFLIAMPLTMLTTVGLDCLWFRPLRRRHAPRVILAVSSLGLGLFIRHVLSLVWGQQPLSYPYVFEGSAAVPGLPLPLSQRQVLAVSLMLILAPIVSLLRGSTKWGKAMRATVDSRHLALISGIDIERVVLYSWLPAGALAAAGGMLVGLQGGLYPEMGWDMLIAIFAATFLGGLGSLTGAILGALTVGTAQELSTLLPLPAYKPAVSLVILVCALLMQRPAQLRKDVS